MVLLKHANADQMSRIREEIGEDERRMERDMTNLRRWACQLPNGAGLELPDHLLTVFLRGCKHDIERAKRKLLLYRGARCTWPELYSGCGFGSEDDGGGAFLVPMPDLSSCGRRITVGRLDASDPARLDLQTVVRLALMTGDIRVHEEIAISGDVYVMDLAGVATVGHCARIAAQASALRQAFRLATTAYPQRVHSIHVVGGGGGAVDGLLSALRACAGEKMRRRWILHRCAPSELAAAIGPAFGPLLPVEYGGKAPSLARVRQMWIAELRERKDWFRKLDAASVAAPAPPLHLHCAPANSDLQGSFRQLAID